MWAKTTMFLAAGSAAASNRLSAFLVDCVFGALVAPLAHDVWGWRASRLWQFLFVSKGSKELCGVANQLERFCSSECNLKVLHSRIVLLPKPFSSQTLSIVTLLHISVPRHSAAGWCPSTWSIASSSLHRRSYLMFDVWAYCLASMPGFLLGLQRQDSACVSLGRAKRTAGSLLPVDRCHSTKC
jgi:hypothetical protein